jgi:undecaprenyl-diphosphatase
LIKKAVERERPCQVDNLNAKSRIHCGQGYSFPSSHATNHFGIAMFLFLLFSIFSYRYLLFFWAGLISVSQVYVGVHYPSDILAGALLGLLIGFICYKLFDRFAFYFNKQETNINVI